MTVNVKEENWVGTKEAAEFLGVKPATIRDWIRKGKDIPRMNRENIVNGTYFYCPIDALGFEISLIIKTIEITLTCWLANFCIYL